MLFDDLNEYYYIFLMPAAIITRRGTSSNAAAKVRISCQTRKYFPQFFGQARR